MNQNVPTIRLLTIDDVLRLTGYKSRSSVYRNMRRYNFPRPVVLGGGRIRWRSSDIEQWVQSLNTQSYS